MPKRKANDNNNIVDDTLKQIRKEVNPSIYAQFIANKFFNGQQSTDSSHALLLDMVHDIVTEPPSDDVLRKYLMFLIGWEEHPYGSSFSLTSSDPRYTQYKADLLMLYNKDSTIPAAILKRGSLELSNSTVMQIIQDILAKRCPYSQGCTRTNPIHIALMHTKTGGKRRVKRTYKSYMTLRKSIRNTRTKK